MEVTYAQTKKLERQYAVVAGRAFQNDAQFRDRKLQWMKRPRYKPEQTRVVIDDGVVVAGVAVVELPVKYGNTVLKLGGISTVATDPDRQGHGYGRANMDDTVQFHIDDEYDISFLLGISNYYHRFGYRTALSWSMIEVNLRSHAPDMPAGWKARRMRKADIPAMDAIYRDTIGTCDLSVVRERCDWEWYFTYGRMGRPTDRVILNPAGEVAGYCAIEPKGGTLRVAEVASVNDEKAYDALLATVKDVGREQFAATAELFAVPDGGFENYCFYEKFGRKIESTAVGGGPMLRLFNTETLFGKIGETLAARWKNAPRSVPDEAVTIDSLGGTVALVPSGNRLKVMPGEKAGAVVKIPGEALVEMVLGYRPVSEIMRHDSIKAAKSAIRVLSAVFPPQTPFMPPTDHF